MDNRFRLAESTKTNYLKPELDTNSQNKKKFACNKIRNDDRSTSSCISSSIVEKKEANHATRKKRHDQ